MRLTKPAHLTFLALFSLACFACGGGGGGGGGKPFEGPIAGGGGELPFQGGDGGGTIPGSVSFRVLVSGNTSLITTFREEVVRDWPAYGALWVEHYGVMPPGVGAPDVGPPNVDFDNEIVVAIFLGTKPTDGWPISILGVTLQGADLLVDYLVDELSISCPGVTNTPSNPFIFIAVTKVPGAVRLSRLDRTSDCP